MKNKVINISIIGCGRVSDHYKSIFRSLELDSFKLVGCFDLNQDKSKNFANFFNIKSYENYANMLEESKQDLVIVLTPSGSHYDISKQALTCNVNVLVEKPATLLPQQIVELYKLSEEKKLLYAVSFQNRLNPSIQLLKKNFHRLGKIITSSVVLRWCRFQDYYDDEWHGTWKNDGGVTNQQAIHHIDVMNYILGPIKELITSNCNRLNDLEAEDTSVSIIKFENGGLGTVELTTAARPIDYEASIKIVGEKGMVSIGGVALNHIENWYFEEIIPEDVNFNSYSEKVPNGYGLSHKSIIINVINYLNGNKNAQIIRAIDSLETCKLIHSMYKSHETGKWVNVKDNLLSNYLGK